MGILLGVLYVLLVIVSLFLCFVILIQESKSGGLSTAFGGGGDTVLGASAQKQISKFTVYVSVVFFALCIGVSLLSQSVSGTSRAAEVTPPPAGVEGVGTTPGDVPLGASPSPTPTSGSGPNAVGSGVQTIAPNPATPPENAAPPPPAKNQDGAREGQDNGTPPKGDGA